MKSTLHAVAALTGAVAVAAAMCASPLAAQAPDNATNIAPEGVRTVMTEDFEGAWPGIGWAVVAANVDLADRYWGKEDYRQHGGTWSAWPASAGVDAVDPASSVYPNYMDTQMTYGPFDLSNAIDAEITFWMWLETEVFVEETDYIWYGVSAGGNFDEKGLWEGSLDWQLYTINLADYLGDNTVWVRWDFVSDKSVGLGGAYIDDITIRKSVVSIVRNGSNIELSWPAVEGATGYQVWWGVNAPYFTPGSTCPATNCASVTTTAFIQTNAVSTASNTTYVVLVVKETGRSAPTSRVGEFDFSLTKGG